MTSGYKTNNGKYSPYNVSKIRPWLYYILINKLQNLLSKRCSSGFKTFLLCKNVLWQSKEILIFFHGESY